MFSKFRGHVEKAQEYVSSSVSIRKDLYFDCLFPDA